MTQLSYGAYVAGTNGTAQQTLVSTSRNNGVSTAKAYVLTVDTATDDTVYSVDLTFPGQVTAITISFTSGTGTTKTLIRDGLQAAWNAEPLATGRALTADNSTDALTITAIAVGVDYTLANASALMTLGAASGGGTPDLIPFGRMVSDSDEGLQCTESVLADFTAQVVSVTPSDAVADTIYTIDITLPGFGGIGYSAQYVSGDTTMANVIDGLKDALNAVLPAASVVAANSGDTKVTLTSELEGYGMTVSAGASDHGLSTPAMTIALDTPGSDIRYDLAGVATYSAEFAASTNAAGDVGYPGFADVNVLQKGTVLVNTAAAVSVGDSVYYCFGTSDTGAWSNDAGSTAADWRMLDPSQFRWSRQLSSTLAVLSINLLN